MKKESYRSNSDNFRIVFRTSDGFVITYMEIRKSILYVKSKLSMGTKMPMTIESHFNFVEIQTLMKRGLYATKYKTGDQDTLFMFPISEDYEWKIIISPEVSEDFFKFMKIL